MFKAFFDAVSSVFANNRLSAALTAVAVVLGIVGYVGAKHAYDLWILQNSLIRECNVLLDSSDKDKDRLIKLEKTKNEVIQKIDNSDDLLGWADAYNRMLQDANKRAKDN